MNCFYLLSYEEFLNWFSMVKGIFLLIILSKWPWQFIRLPSLNTIKCNSKLFCLTIQWHLGRLGIESVLCLQLAAPKIHNSRIRFSANISWENLFRFNWKHWEYISYYALRIPILGSFAQSATRAAYYDHL